MYIFINGELRFFAFVISRQANCMMLGRKLILESFAVATSLETRAMILLYFFNETIIQQIH